MMSSQPAKTLNPKDRRQEDDECSQKGSSVKENDSFHPEEVDQKAALVRSKVADIDTTKNDDTLGNGESEYGCVNTNFPQKLLEILNDGEHSDIVSWLPHGRGFMIFKKKEFETIIMPKHFQKNSKFSSFTRKLNRWGFVRVTRGPEMGAYYHKFFKRDQANLCMQMNCQKSVGLATNDLVKSSSSGIVPPETYAQMGLMQQPGQQQHSMAGGQDYLQMQQQHLQFLMLSREQMIQRQAFLNSQGNGSQVLTVQNGMAPGIKPIVVAGGLPPPPPPMERGQGMMIVPVMMPMPPPPNNGLETGTYHRHM